jgi:predicted molibdopterin-dependent oxidoreductase YjgC
VRALAEQAESVIAITMFHGLAVGWADLVLPGTSYLERDGSYVNLEGRIQRLRRASIPPAPDELAWLSRLAERFGVHVSPYPSVVFEEVSNAIYGGLPFAELGERASLRGRSGQVPGPGPGTRLEQASPSRTPAPDDGMRLLRYRPLFSGPAVERVPELQFQRPGAEAELSPEDAQRLGIRAGDEIAVRSNGTSVTLRAALSRGLSPGIVRVADEHAGALEARVEVTRAS